MDVTGRHAQRRARREDELSIRPESRNRYSHAEDLSPLHEQFIGGFNIPIRPPGRPSPSPLGVPGQGSGPLLPPRTPPLHHQPSYPYGPYPPPPHPPSSPLPPPPPPKDEMYAQPGFHVPQPQHPPYPSPSVSEHYGQPPYQPQYQQQYQQQPTITAAELTHLSAVERSQTLKVARMNPHLQFMVGPLLRYDTVDQDGIWHGAAMIVTADAGSIYEPHPTLTYEWDPDKKVVEGFQSESESQSSLTGEKPSFELGPHPADPYSTVQPASLGRTASSSSSSFYSNGYDGYRPPGSNASKEIVPGQEIYVYGGQGGTFTFWRFLIKIPLGSHEMMVSYNINSGQQFEFYVPGRKQNMRWAAHSCNGFSAGVNELDFCGPGFKSGYDPVWVDLLARHAETPFHVLVGGGDQLYSDSLMREAELQDWVKMKPDEKLRFELTPEMTSAIDRFYFNHYCQAFRRGAFARANSSIPMINMCDDHDIIDGFGSYPDDLQRSSVFSAIGSKGYFYFLLFQCFINPKIDGYSDDPGHHYTQSLIIGDRGPYVHANSHSFLSYMGPSCYILLLDCRAERRKERVCSTVQYKKVFDRLSMLPSNVEHLIVQLGIPIAYPRMVFLEQALDSKLNPLVALGKSGAMGLSGFVNKFNAEAELLDDLNDHWTARSHKKERNWFISQLQQVALAQRLRISFVSGDVHCAAVGLFKTLGSKGSKAVEPPADHRYMLNVVTSAIVNTPPPNPVITMVSSLATKVHKTLHHIETDETMIPVFQTETNGTPRKQKYIMGRRNWCKVVWDGHTGDVVFDIRVEKEKGHGETVGYVVRAPPPTWSRR